MNATQLNYDTHEQPLTIGAGETRWQKLDRALLAAERLLHAAAEDIAAARHDLELGAAAPAQRTMNEGGKKASDALSILHLLPSLTAGED